MRRAAGVGAVYLSAAILLTWPLVTIATTHLGAPEGPGDPYLNEWILGWGIHSWLTDPANVFSGRAFDAPLFHPARLTLTYSDHQLLQALVVSPVYALTRNLALCYNVVLLLSIAASGLAMHALTRGVTGSTAAAYVAGLAWACWPYRTAHLIHIQLQALFFLPLALWALARLAAGRRWRDAIWVGVCAGLQAIVSVYYGVMTGVVLTLAAITLAWTTGQWRKSRYWSRVAVAALVGAAFTVPVAVPYLRSKEAEGFGRNLYEAANHSASIQSYTQVPPFNALYGRTGLLAPRPPEPGQRDRRHVEHQMFGGVVVTLLAIAGLVLGWRSDRRPLVVTGVVLFVAGFWLSLGPEGPLGLYAWLATHVAGFDAIRAPARFSVVAMLGAVLLAAVAVARLTSSMNARRRVASTMVVVVAMMAEYVNVGIPWAPAPATSTRVGRWLRDAPEPGPVLYLPIGLDRENTPYMIESLEHGRPIVNGYSGQRPGHYTVVVEALATLPGVEGLAMLDELSVRYVVSNGPIAGAGQPDSPLVEQAVLDGRTIYEVRWTPESEAALDDVEVEAPPPPGPIPFHDGEVATYEVRWIGDLPAGTLVLSARTPTADERSVAPAASWHFEASGATADWMQRMYEARNRFSTLATEALAPIVHLRDVQEGSRTLVRAYVFDEARSEVRVGQDPDEAASDDALSSRLAPGARDAVTALFYARTLPLEVGQEIAIPVNDAGRSLVVRLRVEGRETVPTPWGPTEAFRLAPSIERRLERRQGISTTLWMTTDDRRVLVRLDLSAGFGRVRADLVDYRR
jgi:hypothetical protein